MAGHALLVADQSPAWAGALGPVHEARPAELAAEVGRGALREAACAVVDGTVRDAPGVARRIHAADPTLQVVVVAPADGKARLQHALLFLPGLGEVWLVEPPELNASLVERAGDVTRQRRRYRAVRPGIERSLAAAPARVQRTRLSDAYLASLLQSVPDPVLSVDEAGRILSWNPAAERVLGRPAHEVAGRPLAEVLAPDDPAPVERLLARAGGIRRAELRFRRAGGEEGTGELIVAPVDADGQNVRSVIVHDLTEQRRAQAELETQAAELQEQAAELELLNDELQQRTRELEAALGTRSRFYAAMSHELRTPINAVIGYNALLLDGIYGPLQERQEYGLTRSQRAAQHLLELVNDVLDLAKIEAGRIELQVERTPFPTVLEEVADTVRSLAEQHGSRIEVAGAAEPHAVSTDPRRLRQILLNLLSNAAKFGDGKPIELGWDPTPDGGVEVRVADHGRGIAPADLERIFHEFEQVETREGGGTGLGLPISRRLAEILGGSLRVDSTVDEGSTFRLRLPPAPPAG
ncbi:MAG TPA: PAS domain-containing sensor histidine kinase [Longimicrobiaceae bacterium]|nr:PAS domain-containing sensor histidine kinase [Longimicrobiaceae bacterium]